jgi:hypothetical protein
MYVLCGEEGLNYFGSLKYSMKHENITKVPFLSGFPCANPACISLKANSEAPVLLLLFILLYGRLVHNSPWQVDAKRPCWLRVEYTYRASV